MNYEICDFWNQVYLHGVGVNYEYNIHTNDDHPKEIKISIGTVNIIL